MINKIFGFFQYKIILVTGLICFSIMTAQGQTKRHSVRYGIRGGLNLANASGDFEENTQSKLGYYGGIFVEYPIKILYKEHFALQAEANYTNKGFRIERDNPSGSGSYEQKYALSYIQVPLFFKVYFIKEFNFHIGPYFSYKINQNTDGDPVFNLPGDSGQAFDFENTRDFQMGFSFGAEYRFDSEFLIQLRYNYGLTKIFNDFELHHSLFQFGVGYKF